MLKGKVIVGVSVDKAKTGQLFYAFNVPLIRVGKTNQVMPPDQQRARLLEGASVWTEERDRPENWWERPSAPVFRLHLASYRPPTGQWVFEVELEQVDGGDIGNLRYRYRLGEIEHELKQPTLLQKRKWRLDKLAFQPQGQPVELELRFWWEVDERSVTYRWEKERDFQSREYTIRY